MDKDETIEIGSLWRYDRVIYRVYAIDETYVWINRVILNTSVSPLNLTFRDFRRLLKLVANNEVADLKRLYIILCQFNIGLNTKDDVIDMYKLLYELKV